MQQRTASAITRVYDQLTSALAWIGFPLLAYFVITGSQPVRAVAVSGICAVVWGVIFTTYISLRRRYR